MLYHRRCCMSGALSPYAFFCSDPLQHFAFYPSYLKCRDIYSAICCNIYGGTAAAAPTPFGPGKPALCGSRPLVTPYYCRLGDLLCYIRIFLACTISYICVYYVLCIVCVFFLCRFSFSTLILLVRSFDL